MVTNEGVAWISSGIAKLGAWGCGTPACFKVGPRFDSRPGTMGGGGCCFASGESQK